MIEYVLSVVESRSAAGMTSSWPWLPAISVPAAPHPIVWAPPLELLAVVDPVDPLEAFVLLDPEDADAPPAPPVPDVSSHALMSGIAAAAAVNLRAMRMNSLRVKAMVSCLLEVGVRRRTGAFERGEAPDDGAPHDSGGRAPDQETRFKRGAAEGIGNGAPAHRCHS